MGFEIYGIDELMKELSYLDAERLAPMMLEAATPVVEKAIVNRLSRHKDRGDLMRSIKSTKVTRNQYGHFVAVRPNGKDRKGVSNAKKLAGLEFGVAGKQLATPVMASAVNAAENEALQVMQQVFDREVGD